jgi:group I intron endonuclease
MGWIYNATNKLNGKGYIGQTIRSIKKRLKEHQQENSNCRAFSGAIKKYGWENFVIDCYECPDDELNKHERWMINLMGTLSPNGYNLKEGGGPHGQASEESKQKMRKPKSDKHKQSIREARLGTTHNEGSKQKNTEAHLGKKHSNESIQKMSGENHNKSKRIYQYDLDGIFIASFGSTGEAGRHIKGEGGDGSLISKCANDKIGRRKTAYNFKWSYELIIFL